MDDAPTVPRISGSAIREALEEVPATVELSVSVMEETETVASYVVPIESTAIKGDAGEAAVIDADVQIANGVLRAVAAGWNNVKTIKDVSVLANLTMSMVERRRKLLNHQHGAASTTKTLNLNDYVS